MPDNYIQELKNLIEKSNNILITTHKSPDGDAMGSALGMANFLINKQKQVHVLVPDDIPEFLQWIPGIEQVNYYNKSAKNGNKLIQDADLILCLDFNAFNRIDAYSEKIASAKAKKVMIDHHPYPENFADITISDTSVSSTGELLYLTLRQLDKNLININVATCLYTGILTDTGCFSFNSSNPLTFEVVSELLAIGIDRDKIYNQVYNTFSFNRMQLLGTALKDKMVYLPEYRTAFISLTKEDLEQYNFQPGDTEGFVNLPLSIKGIVFSALFTEKDKKIRISFRSKGNFGVNKFSSSHFNGGGHFNASGGDSFKNMEETIDTFINLLPKYKEELLNA